MSEKGKRRSARLIRLEEQQKIDGGGGGGGLLDPWQIIRNSISGAAARGKRKMSDAEIQGEASCSQPIDAAYTSNALSSQRSSTGHIIEYILDTLELKDTHELFAMPDDIQVNSNYEERVNRPGDFATLRQKNTDGMYKTLEQFENDVYMVFQKAISINSQDTIPYREAMWLLDQAKQIFLSLRSNQMYSEPEIMAWRQKQLDVGRGKAAREEDEEEGSDRGHAAAAPTEELPSSPAKTKAGAAEKRQQSAGDVAADNGKARPRGGRDQGGKNTPGKRARKVATMVGAGGAGVERRRLGYTDEAGQSRAVATVLAFQDRREDKRGAIVQQRPLVEGHTYLESLRRFVRHAGLKARVAAELRSLECDARARQNPSPPAYWNGFTPGAGTGEATGFQPYRGYCPPSSLSISNSVDEQQALPECRLETDELLRLVMLMGTPAFLERAKQVFGGAPGEESSKSKQGLVTRDGDDVTFGVPVAAATVGVTAAAAPQQKSSASQPAAPPQKSSASQPAASQQSQPVAPQQKSSASQPAAPQQKSSASLPATPQQKNNAGQPAAPQQKSSASQPAAPQQKSSASQPAKPRPKSSASQPAKPQQKRSASQPAKPQQKSSASQPAKPQQKSRASQPAKPQQKSRASQPAKPQQKSSASQLAKPQQKSSASEPVASQQKSSASQPAAPEQKSGASKPAVEFFGPFAPPKLVPGPLGFSQFASSSARPFKSKPAPMLNSPGKKKSD